MITASSSASSPFQLPTWVAELVREVTGPTASTHDRMALAIRLAGFNVDHDLGGPFGAAVFEATTGSLLAVGVNLVTATNCSHAHAEMVALANAQQRIGNYDLGASSNRLYELVTSCEPCAMCYGAIQFSGIGRLVCGARSEDAEACGFDEGVKPVDWVAALQERHIDVVRDVSREAAAAVLRDYRQRGGLIYNPRRGGDTPIG
jgi:tRNA(Arg) A34 adenosine deaminase TadA